MGNTRLGDPAIQSSTLHSEMVSAAGIAPAIPRSQAECVGCYATRWFAPMILSNRDGRIARPKPWELASR